MPNVTCSNCWLWQPLGRSSACRACGAPLLMASGMRVDQAWRAAREMSPPAAVGESASSRSRWPWSRHPDE